MAAWKIAARELYAKGGAGTYADVADRSALCALVSLGLATSDGRQGGVNRATWTLTQRGIDWCEGRVSSEVVRPGGRRWFATWLASLPRDIRIAPPAEPA